MSEYVITHGGRTFFVPTFVVNGLLPEFVERIENYLEVQKATPPHKQQSAYKVLSQTDLSKADEWLAALIIAPISQYDDGYTVGELGLGGFTKYYAKAWEMLDPQKPRDGFEAVIRLIRLFMDMGLVSHETTRPRGQVEQLVTFVLTEAGREMYPTFELETADEDRSKSFMSSEEPIEYMTAPWLPSCGKPHIEAQSDEVDTQLASQATAASSVGYVVPSNIAKVYTDWFHTSRISPKAEAKLDRFLQTKERHKFVTVRRMQKLRHKALAEIADTVLYYKVGYDRKARQYMLGYPVNPQGAKVDRPLFSVLAPRAPQADIIADITMVGEDLFGKDWPVVSQLTVEELENHNDPFIKGVCTTKGELDLHKYTTLLEYAKETECSTTGLNVDTCN